MTYKKSAPKREFELQIASLKSDIKLAKKLSAKALFEEASHAYQISQCVYRNAVFQCSSSLEQFIKDILDLWLHNLAKLKKPISALPEEFITYLKVKKNINDYKSFIIYNDESALIKKIMSDKAEHIKYYTDTTCISTIGSIGWVVNDKKYPSIENIKKLFQRFGIDDIYSLMQRKFHRDFRADIKTLSDTRTAIAHQYPSPPLTDTDTIRLLERVLLFVSKIDRALYHHVKKTSGLDIWVEMTT